MQLSKEWLYWRRLRLLKICLGVVLFLTGIGLLIAQIVSGTSEKSVSLLGTSLWLVGILLGIEDESKMPPLFPS